MPIKILMIIVAAGLSFAQDSTGVENQSGMLVVKIWNIPSNEGRVRIALANSEENFSGSDSAFRAQPVEISEGMAEVVFKAIPYGEYAVKVFHDENDDGELDKNFFGAPTEAYGFSNNARGSFGPASWEDARFTFKAMHDSININVE